MADLESHDSGSTVAGDLHPSHEYDDAFQASAHVQVPDSHYLEVNSHRLMPTKAGGEEAVSETQIDRERPRTAGSAYSGTTDFDQTEDGAVLASLAVSTASDREMEASPLSPPRAIGSLFSRPTSDSGEAMDLDFSFAKAMRPQFAFSGKRKSPHSNAAMVSTDAVLPDPAKASDATEHDQAVESPHHGDLAASSTQNEGSAPAVKFDLEDLHQPPVQPTGELREKKRKKKKRSRRYDTAPTEPTEPTERYSRVVPAATTTVQQTMTFDNIDGNEQSKLSHASELGPQYSGRSRPTTPLVSISESQQEAAVGSPHSQLNSDLQAAAFVQEQPGGTGGGHQASLYVGPGGNTEPQAPDVEPLSPFNTTRPLPQLQPTSNAAESVYAGPHRSVSGRSDARRVTKRKSKTGKRANAPAPAETMHSDQSSSDVNDWLQVLSYKVEEKRQSSSRRFDAERKALRAEMQQTTDSMQALQADLDNVQQQKSSLAIVVEQQKTKVKIYAGKINRFKTFVDGLGNDVDSLKKEASVTRRKGEQLSQVGEDRKVEQTVLFQQLSSCAEKSTQLKHEALKACQEIQSELQAAQLRNNYLEQQLSERVGLLAEERDRRSQLERQLTTATHSDEAVLRAINSNNDAVLDKLFEMHAFLEDAGSSSHTTEITEKTLAALQALTSQHSANADDILSARSLIESLSESVDSYFGTANATREDQQSNVTSLQDHVDDALKGLRDDLDRSEKLMQQDAVHRETINTLQNRLQACNIQATDANSRVSAAQARESQLKEQNDSLQAKITALQSEFSPGENAHVQLSEMKAELDAKGKALDSAKADLNSKASELRTLLATNASLQDQIETLQRRLEEALSQVVDIGPGKAELEQRFGAELEKMQKEMAEHSHKTYVKDRMDIDNQLKQLTSQRDSYKRQVQPLKDEAAASKARLEEHQTQSSKSSADKERELQQQKKLAQSCKQEIETLKSSLRDLQSTLKGGDLIRDKYNTLSIESTAEKAKYAKEKTTLAKQIEEMQHALEQAQSAEEEAKVELDKQRSESVTASEDAQNQLAEAKEAAHRAEAGLQHYKQTCKQSIENTELQCKKQLDALQECVTQAQKEVQDKKNDDEKFRAAIQESWQAEQQENDRRLANAKKEAIEVKTQRDDALAENERLRSELEELSKKQAEVLQAKRDQHIQQRPPSGDSNTSASRLRVPNLREGITPTASNKENEPSKPRKKVDRSANTVMETAPVPAPDVLRRPESRSNAPFDIEGNPRGPVVEESQFQDIVPAARGDSRSHQAKASLKPSLSGFFSDNDDMLDFTSLASKQLPQTVEETQYEDKFPSFAAFNGSMHSSQAPRLQAPSSAFSVPFLRGGSTQPPAVSHPTNSEDMHRDSFASAAQTQSNGFVVYEDPQQRQSSSDAHNMLQDSLSWSQAEKEKYTFRKIFPNPNSASKMVHGDKEDSQGAKRRRSGGGSVSLSQRSGVYNPELLREGRDSASEGMQHPNAAQTLAMHSSSPDFVHNAVSARKTSTYHTPGGSAKRRISKTNSVPTADPRLAGREAPTVQKRKSEGHTVEGYEHERKKRLNRGSTAAPVEPSRYSLRGNAQQPSINDLPSMPNVSGSSSSRNGSFASQTRMRTLGGASSRSKPGFKKMSKNDDVNARFAQELRR